MDVYRREMAQLLLLSVCLLIGSQSTAVLAQVYPVKPLRLIVPYPPGTPPDIVSRLVAPKLASGLGQPVVVENRPGATGTVGLRELANQPADGYTLLTFLTPMTLAPWFYSSFAMDLRKDFDPVGQMDWFYQVLVVHPDVPARSVKELEALLKSKPAQLNFASGGNGTPAHLSGELFKLQTGISALHVPYNQISQAIGDLVAGRIQFMFLSSSPALPHIQAGKLRPLAVTGLRRIHALQSVPTMIEEGFPEFVIRSWDGLIVKSGTPKEIIARLNAELVKAIATPEIRERFAALGADPVSGSPQQFGELISSEIEVWGRVAKAANIKVD